MIENDSRLAAEAAEAIPEPTLFKEAIRRLQSADFSFSRSDTQEQELQEQLAAAMERIAAAAFDAVLDARLEQEAGTVTPEAQTQLQQYRELVAGLRSGVAYREQHHMPPVAEQVRRIRNTFETLNTRQGYAAVAEQLLSLSQQPDAAEDLAALQQEASELMAQFEDLDATGVLHLNIRELYATAHELNTGSGLLSIEQVAAQLPAAQRLLADIQRAAPLFELFKQPHMREDAYLFLRSAVQGFEHSLKDQLVLGDKTRDAATFLREHCNYALSEVDSQQLQTVQELLTQFRTKGEAALHATQEKLRNLDVQPSGIAQLLQTIKAVFVQEPDTAYLRVNLELAEARQQRELQVILNAEQLLASPELKLLQDVYALQRSIPSETDSTAPTN